MISLSRHHSLIIASISFVLDVQSLFKSRVFALLHRFSIGFREGEFFYFCSMTGSQVLQKNSSFVGECSFYVFYHFTLNYFNIFDSIHHPLNREKRLNTFKAILWYRDSRVGIPNGGGIFLQDLAPCLAAKKVKKILKKVASRSLTDLGICSP